MRHFDQPNSPSFHKSSIISGKIALKQSKKEQAEAHSLIIQFELLLNLKGILTKSADGALEVFGKIFPRRAGGDTVVGISKCGIVFITAGAYLA